MTEGISIVYGASVVYIYSIEHVVYTPLLAHPILVAVILDLLTLRTTQEVMRCSQENTKDYN